MFEKLTFKSIDARAALVPLRRPVVSKVGLFGDWPLVLIDLYTNEGIVGRSYLEPYLKNSARYIIPAIQDLAATQVGKPLAPLESFQANRRSLNLVGYEGVAMIAVSGVDMAIWDALAKAADLPLAALLGGTVGPVDCLRFRTCLAPVSNGMKARLRDIAIKWNRTSVRMK